MNYNSVQGLSDHRYRHRSKENITHKHTGSHRVYSRIIRFHTQYKHAEHRLAATFGINPSRSTKTGSCGYFSSCENQIHVVRVVCYELKISSDYIPKMMEPQYYVARTESWISLPNPKHRSMNHTHNNVIPFCIHEYNIPSICCLLFPDNKTDIMLYKHEWLN